MPIDYKDYPEDWHAISERIRFVRADNKCEQCGVPNGCFIRRSKANGQVHAALALQCRMHSVSGSAFFNRS